MFVTICNVYFLQFTLEFFVENANILRQTV